MAEAVARRYGAELIWLPFDLHPEYPREGISRAALHDKYGGETAYVQRMLDAFARYDLHYAPQPGAQPFSFGLGNLWRIAVEWPGSPVPPCIHRAPDTQPGDPARLLLIS